MTIHRVRRAALGAVLLLVVGAAFVAFRGIGSRDDGAILVVAEQRARDQLLEAERSCGLNSPEAGEAAWTLSQVLLSNAATNREEGKALAQRALEIKETRPDPEPEDVAGALETYAMWLWLWNDCQAELPVVERALAIRDRQEPKHESAIARDLHFLSECYRVEGDYGRALRLQELAGPSVQRIYGANDEQTAVHFHYLAVIQTEIGDRQAAIANARRAVRIRESMLLPRELARSLRLLGHLLVREGDWKQAELVLERARSTWLASDGADEADPVFALNDLGLSFVARHDDARAAEIFSRVATTRSASLGPDNPLIAPTLRELGAAQRRLGDRVAARVSLRRALEIQAKRQQPLLSEWGAALRELALLDASEGRLDAALTGALESERMTRERFRASALGLSEREALTQARARVGGLDLAWTSASELASRGVLDDRAASELLDESIRSRALVLDTLASRQRILALHPNEETAALVETLRRVQQRLTHLLIEESHTPSSGTPARLSEAQAEAARAERELADKSRAFVQERRRGDPGLAEVRAALPSASALVSYFRHGCAGKDEAAEGAAYVASIVTADGAPARIVPLGSAAEIDSAVGAWGELLARDPRQTGVEAGEARYRDAARRLAAKIWDPLAPLLAGAERVFIVPDAALHAVNLATLVTPRGEFLVETGVSFQYLTAERDLIGIDEQPASGLGLLALGDPAYGATDGSGARRFDPLPGSRKEAEQVAAQHVGREPTRVLLGDAASESEFRRLAPSFRVLHIATHAFFEMSGPNAGNPLRVAGLAMAGANRDWKPDDPSHEDDGILTAEEIALLDLRGVEWAVLSACATGRGALVPGEGVLGLRRAFQIAGARTLIVSLWPVEDDATRYWMTRLYAARAKGATTVDAVRAASRAVLEKQRRAGLTTHPYSWGGFISIGDWR